MAAGLFVIAVLAFVGLAESGGHHGLTLMCKNCHHVTDPTHCTTFEACPGELCGMTVNRNETGFTTFHMTCLGPHDCGDSIVIGKRRPHHDFGPEVCKQCCNSTQCNDKLCSNFQPTHSHIILTAPPVTTTTHATHTKAPTTTAAPQPPTTQPPTAQPPSTNSPTTEPPTTQPPTTLNPCHDVEDENFRCVDWDQYNFCTDVSGVAHAIAVTRCRKHCGFCTTSCKNTEDSLFSCEAYDKNFNLCHDTSPVSVQLAHEKCPLYCNFCLPDGTIVVTSTTPAPTTSVATSEATVTLALPCEDREDETFSCSEWFLHNFCSATEGTLFEIGQSRCRKTCGYCT